jgi:hypothetical protein
VDVGEVVPIEHGRGIYHSLERAYSARA